MDKLFFRASAMAAAASFFAVSAVIHIPYRGAGAGDAGVCPKAAIENNRAAKVRRNCIGLLSVKSTWDAAPVSCAHDKVVSMRNALLLAIFSLALAPVYAQTAAKASPTCDRECLRG